MRVVEQGYEVIVIGGGAAGMFAAGTAGSCGARVLLLEKTGDLGKKLLITGKGRCNITNNRDKRDFVESYGRNGRFLYSAFSVFFKDDLIGFFEHNGVPTKVERGDRVFPQSDESGDVVAALKRFMSDNHVTVRYHSRVNRIIIAGGRAVGVEIEGGTRFAANTVIVATGGMSYPRTGSTGDGYRLVAEAGHTIVTPRPALVPLETAEPFVKELQGLGLKNVQVTVIANGKKAASEFGEMLFTHFGVSGPVLLTLSGGVVDRLARGEKIEISINFKPALDQETIHRRLLREFDESGLKSIVNILRNLLPESLVPVFVRCSGIPADKKGNQVNRGERERLYALLTDFRLTVTKARPIDEAIVTRGGVALDEIDPRTMESKKTPGLYCCGELIDIDGKTGGYNLQAAFSTGYLAGISAGGGHE